MGNGGAGEGEGKSSSGRAAGAGMRGGKEPGPVSKGADQQSEGIRDWIIFKRLRRAWMAVTFLLGKVTKAVPHSPIAI